MVSLSTGRSRQTLRLAAIRVVNRVGRLRGVDESEAGRSNNSVHAGNGYRRVKRREQRISSQGQRKTTLGSVFERARALRLRHAANALPPIRRLSSLRGKATYSLFVVCL